MTLEANDIAYLVLIQLSYLIIILTAVWQLYKATNTGHYKKHFAVSIAIAIVFISLLFLLAGFIFPDFSNAVAGIFFLPLALVITLIMFTIRRRFIAWWLGIYLLMPSIYSNYIYIKVKGLDSWLHSFWAAGSFNGFQIFTMQLITPAHFFLTGQFEMTNSVPLSIMALEFVIIGIIAASVDWLITNKFGKASQDSV